MESQWQRTEILTGSAATERLKNSRVAVFGVGGVGGYVAESLARSGVGTLDIIDKDVVSISNINRQMAANHETVGRKKTEVIHEHCRQINPDIVINCHDCFFLPKTSKLFDFSLYDYVVDAVDTVTAKLEIIERANEAGVPVISCMGTGNKLNSAAFRVADLYETSICPLAKVMRRECKKRGIHSLRVVFSTEPPIKRGEIPGSTPFAPAMAGLLMAEEIFRNLVQI